MTSEMLTGMDSMGHNCGMASGEMVWKQLQDALIQENQLPLLYLKHGSKNDPSEVTANMRDSFAQVLRCLKVWYDVSPDCWFLAINIMDRFFAKMKVQPKHLACIAVSCFHLAMKLTNSGRTSAATNQGKPDGIIEDILNISQTQCTASDMTRMQQIIVNKLDCNLKSITPINFAMLFSTIYDQNKPVGHPDINHEAMMLKLEILLCNYQCTEFRSCTLALALFSCILEASYMSSGLPTMEPMLFISSLQNYCAISDGELYKCRQTSMDVLDYYDRQQQFPLSQRQQLIWKLSRRTILQLKPTARITSILPTIEEADLRKFSNIRNRHDSDSDGMGGSETAEDEDDMEQEPVTDNF